MQGSDFDKPLPMDKEAERMIVGCILIDNSLLADAAATLHPQDFLTPSLRDTFRVMLAMGQRQLEINPVTLMAALRSQGMLENAGGPAGVAALFDGVPRFSNIDSYIRLVRDAAARRALIKYAYAVAGRAYDGGDDASAMLADSRRMLDGITDPAGGDGWQSVTEAATTWFGTYKQSLADGRTLDGLATGFTDLDRHLNGIPVGTLNIIGGRPGMGKTGFLTSFIDRALSDHRNAPENALVAVFALEMSTSQLIQRWAAGLAGLPLWKLRTKRLSESDIAALAEATERIAALPVVFDDRAHLTPNRFRAAVREVQRKHPDSRIVAVIDYLQSMHGDGRYTNKVQEVTDISHRLRDIIRDDLNCYCIAAASLNRQSEARGDKRPGLADLRESGDLESDAANVLLLHRDDYYRPDYKPTNREEADLIVAKGRFCGPGTVRLAFNAETVRFGDTTGDRW